MLQIYKKSPLKSSEIVFFLDNETFGKTSVTNCNVEWLIIYYLCKQINITARKQELWY